MRRSPHLMISAVLCACGLFAGCASYEVRLTQPAEAAAKLESQELSFEKPPLEFRINDLKDRVGLRIINNADDAVTLVGEKSYVVDPSGQSRTIGGGTIAPHSFLALSVPPVHREYRDRSGFGLGIGGGSGGGFAGVGVGHSWDEGGDPTVTYKAFPWEQGEVRVHLAFQRGESTSAQDFTFDREKVQ